MDNNCVSCKTSEVVGAKSIKPESGKETKTDPNVEKARPRNPIPMTPIKFRRCPIVDCPLPYTVCRTISGLLQYPCRRQPWCRPRCQEQLVPCNLKKPVPHPRCPPCRKRSPVVPGIGMKSSPINGPPKESVREQPQVSYWTPRPKKP